MSHSDAPRGARRLRFTRHARSLTTPAAVETPRRRRLLPWLERRETPVDNSRSSGRPDAQHDSARRSTPIFIRTVLGILATVVATVMAALLLSTPASAQLSSQTGDLVTRQYTGELIGVFDSTIDVQRDGDLLVTERLLVNAQGQQIRRGILRDFPTLYRAKDGLRVEVGFEVLDVKRDNRPEPYELEKLSNGVRIRIGSADRMLAPGAHIFEIRYRTTRQLGFYADHDELYWNVTGTGWTLPIVSAIARVHLPDNAAILRTNFYTGPQGATDKNARVVESKPGSVTFENTRPLGREEGLTIAVSWPKGIVQPPPLWLGVYYQLRDNLALLVAVVGFVLMVAYYVVAYARTRRKSRPNIVPLYEPPDGISAPGVRYLARKGNDSKAFVIGIIELISLRALRIERDESRRGSNKETRFFLLDPDEEGKRGLERSTLLRTMLHKMFGETRTFYRSQAGSTRLRDAKVTLESSLNSLYSPYIAENNKRARRGVWWWLLYIVVCIAALADQGGGVGGTIMSLPFLAVGMVTLIAVYASFLNSGFRWSVLIGFIIFGLPFLLGGIGVLVVENINTPLRALSVALPALLLPVVVRAFRFLRGYTEEGHEIMDSLNGFKQYLTLAEQPRLEALGTVDEKLRVYERYLPYAMALDVGDKWAAAFAGLSATVAGLAAVQAMQGMYGGYDFYDNNPDRALSAISGDVAPRPVVVSSSSGSPGSSSSWSGSDSSSSGGSSDSGSSGDGGGGGGGSGW
ncbi:DUF2207 domain-containing protein [Bordetella sp. N]|uniref:DUF2207 domain-containing protein n=1 Tax=Bordetella sp. N TaxID=1746199 RepID=UPI00070CA9D4|nr:DUF2207 domain-containing protein [Bordetella sp. N]ALM86304.1 hypothetical protein ASB57_28215 [Bordetella sp. N]